MNQDIRRRLLVIQGDMEGREFEIPDVGFEIRPSRSADLHGSYRIVIEDDLAAIEYHKKGEWERLGEIRDGDTFVSRNSVFKYLCATGDEERQTNRIPTDYTRFDLNPDPPPELPGAVSIRPISKQIDSMLRHTLRLAFHHIRPATYGAAVLDNPFGNGEPSAVFSPDSFVLDKELASSVLYAKQPKAAASSKTDACAALCENGWRFGFIYITAAEGLHFELTDLNLLAHIAKMLAPPIGKRIYRLRLRRMSN
jgi:hypothetical protein